MPLQILQKLQEELASIFETHHGVEQIFAFGSIPEDRFDKYSDIDFLIITKDDSTDAGDLYHHLIQYKPVLCRGPFGRDARPCGNYVLGIVFSDESIFHKLDLNCLTVNEFKNSSNLERFGFIQKVLPSKKVILQKKNTSSFNVIELTDKEFEFNEYLFFINKAIKLFFRGKGKVENVRKRSELLQHALDSMVFPKRLEVGDMKQLAYEYLDVSQTVL